MCLSVVDYIQSTDDRQKGGMIMEELRLGVIEGHFADIVWERAPISTRDLVKLCEKELNWKRTTTYTVLKKLCERGIFKTENSTVLTVISKDEFYAMQSERFVDDNFKGSLPAFIAAFSSRKKLSAQEVAEIRKMISEFGEE